MRPEDMDVDGLQDLFLNDSFNVDIQKKRRECEVYCEENKIATPNESRRQTANRSSNKDKITIDALPPIEQNLVAERIFADKLDTLGNIFHKLASNVRDKHFFSIDKDIQKECILGCDAFIEYLRPVYDDKIAGDWKDILDPLSRRIRWQKHWSEDRDCVRDVSYQIFEDGEVKMRHEFTPEHARSDGMLLRLYNIVKITDCSIFASGLFMNNLATRYQQAERARKAKHERGNKR